MSFSALFGPFRFSAGITSGRCTRNNLRGMHPEFGGHAPEYTRIHPNHWVYGIHPNTPEYTRMKHTVCFRRIQKRNTIIVVALARPFLGFRGGLLSARSIPLISTFTSFLKSHATLSWCKADVTNFGSSQNGKVSAPSPSLFLM